MEAMHPSGMLEKEFDKMNRICADKGLQPLGCWETPLGTIFVAERFNREDKCYDMAMATFGYMRFAEESIFSTQEDRISEALEAGKEYLLLRAKVAGSDRRPL